MTKLATLLFAAAVFPACVELDDPEVAQTEDDITCAACATSPNLIKDGGFELGGAWQLQGDAMRYTDASWEDFARSGSSFGYLGRYASAHDAIYQSVAIPANVGGATLKYYVNTFSTDIGLADALAVLVADDTGWHLVDAAYARDATATLEYKLHTVDVSAYRGKTVTLFFRTDQNGHDRTQYLIDDVSLTTTLLNSL